MDLNDKHALMAAPQSQDGFGVSDIGCTKSVAGTEWFDGLRRRMEEYGLQPVQVEDADTTFKGLGGSTRKSSKQWGIPCRCLRCPHDLPQVRDRWQDADAHLNLAATRLGSAHGWSAKHPQCLERAMLAQAVAILCIQIGHIRTQSIRST